MSRTRVERLSDFVDVAVPSGVRPIFRLVLRSTD